MAGLDPQARGATCLVQLALHWSPVDSVGRVTSPIGQAGPVPPPDSKVSYCRLRARTCLLSPLPTHALA